MLLDGSEIYEMNNENDEKQVQITKKIVDVQVTFVNKVDQSIQLFQIHENHQAWTVHRGKDLSGKGDVERIKNWVETFKDEEALKEYVKK